MIADLKTRIFSGWSWVRVMYLGVGIYVIIQSGQDREWFGVIFGSYFASMGLFAYGCASGACFGGACETQEKIPVKNN